MSTVANPAQALHKPTQAKSKYRPEIDGLRAFAVVAVIINHFNKDLLPSGYLGVDIFFVISGYVITSSLAGRESKNFLDFLTGFYERRIKRLVPALVVFVLITSVLICLFNPDPTLVLRTGATSLFGLSNLYLLKQSTDYFAQSTELNPFTHTWSLGVEEQFYLLFPFLIWFSGFGQQTAKGARNLFLWVGALTIASLIGFIYLYQVNQPAAYFLMLPRFWEMAAGCLIFIGFQKRARIEQALEQVPPLLVVAALVGVMLLPVAAAVSATIGVVALSAVLIACLKQGTAAYKFFTLEKVAYVGLISYSLYLWHWTVLCISRWTIGIHWWSAPIQVVLMLCLAVASHRWIETPLRKGNWFGKRWKTLAVGGGVLITLSGAVIFLAKSGRSKLYAGFPLNDSRPAAFLDDCKSHLKGKRIFFLGDSHASQLKPLAERLKKECSMTTYAKMQSLFPVIPTDLYGFDGKKKPSNASLIEKSTRENEQFTDLLSLLEEGDFAVISSRYLCRLRDRCFSVQLSWKDVVFSDYRGASISPGIAFELWSQKLREFAASAHKKGVKVVIMLPTPEIRSSPTLCSKSEWFRPSFAISNNCLVPADVLAGRRDFVDRIRSLEIDNLAVFDPWDYACRGDRDCKALIPSVDLKDATHLSEISVERFALEFLRFILDRGQ